MMRGLLLLLFLVQGMTGLDYEEPILYDTFPDGFIWGAATAAYQVIL